MKIKHVLIVGLIALTLQGCKHFEKKTPESTCDFNNIKSKNKSTKEDLTK